MILGTTPRYWFITTIRYYIYIYILVLTIINHYYELIGGLKHFSIYWDVNLQRISLRTIFFDSDFQKMGSSSTNLLVNGCWIKSLIGGLEHLSFFHILGMIIPNDSYCSVESTTGQIMLGRQCYLDDQCCLIILDP